MKVSLIVAVYNVEKYLGECLESLFSQTYRDIEYVFIDDASTDRSPAILRDAAAARPDRDIRIVRNPVNEGIASVRMKGLSMMGGDFFIFVDSDDTVEPDFIETLAAKAESEGADVVCCDVLKEYSDGKVHLAKAWKDAPADGPSASLAVLRGGIPAYSCNKLVDSALARDIIPPVESYQEDIVMMVQMLFGARKIVRVGRPLYHYKRRHAGAITAGPWKRKHLSSAANMAALYDALPDGPLKELCGGDIALRAGWYSLMAGGFGALRRCPESVKRACAAAPWIRGCRVSVVEQALLKAACRLLQLVF